MYDVLRDNIGLLQPIYEQEEYYYEDYDEPINEGILDLFKKKPSRWQRFKSFVGRNKGKIAAGAIGLGAAGWTGNSLSNYGKAAKRVEDKFKQNGLQYNDHLGWSKHDLKKWAKDAKDGDKAIAYKVQMWRPWKSYGDEAKGKQNMKVDKTTYTIHDKYIEG